MSCDLALIPIPNHALMRSKPENKLILFWMLGLPTVVTDTPSYARVMRDAGVNCAASDLAQWKTLITELATSVMSRETHINLGNNYLINTSREESILSSWDKVFQDASATAQHITD